MSPRRIALVLREAPVGLIGGVERFTLSLAGAWRSLGIDAFVVGGVSADQALSTILDKVPVHGLPATEDLASLRALLAGCERVVVQQWDAFTPELVPLLATEQRVQLWLHDHSTNCARSFRHAPPAGEACPRTLHSAMSHAVCARCVRPLVPNHPDLPAALAQRAVQADKALRGAHTLLAPSRSHAHALQQLHTGIAVRVVEPGVAREYCVPVAPALANDAPLRVLHSGNHSSEKGTCDLAAALQLAAPQQATLVLAGRATEQGLLERLRVLAPAIALEVHGPYEPHTLVPIAASCDLAVFPSRLEESYGLAAAECGRLGLELVVSDRGALPERVQHDPAAIVPSGDVAALAERLRLAVTHKRRGQMRRGVHSQARSIEDTALELSRDS